MPWISVIKRLRFNPKPYSNKSQESLKRESIYLKDEVEQKIDDVLNRFNNNKELKSSMLIEDHTTLIKRKTKNKKKTTKSLVSNSESSILVPIDLKVDTIVNNNDLKDDFVTTTIKTGDEVISEQTGFGWNGLGSRRIIFDNIFKEYCYEILEPQLTIEEEELKNKIIYLFRIHADLDVFDWDENKKKEQLEKL